MTETRPLYIVVGRSVMAIDRATGAEIWRCEPTASSFISGFFTITVEADAIYAGVDGELFCIDPATGVIRWHNPFKGMGSVPITFPGSGGSASAVIPAPPVTV